MTKKRTRTFGRGEFVASNDVNGFVVWVVFGWWSVLEGSSFVTLLSVGGLVGEVVSVLLDVVDELEGLDWGLWGSAGACDEECEDDLEGDLLFNLAFSLIKV